MLKVTGRTGHSTRHMEVKWHMAFPVEYWCCGKTTIKRGSDNTQRPWNQNDLVHLVAELLLAQSDYWMNRRLLNGNRPVSKISQNRGRMLWDQRSNSNLMLDLSLAFDQSGSLGQNNSFSKCYHYKLWWTFIFKRHTALSFGQPVHTKALKYLFPIRPSVVSNY